MKCCSAHAINELQEACEKSNGNHEKLSSPIMKSLQKCKENESLRNAIIDGIEAPIAVISTAKKLIDFNQPFMEGCKQFTGRKPMVGHLLHRHLPCIKKKFIDKQLLSVFKGKKISFEISFEHKLQKKHYSISLSPFLLEKEVGGAIMHAHDISESRSAEEQQNKYASIFDQALDGIMIADFEGRILDVNASTCRIFGYSRKELLSMNLVDLYDPEYLKSDPIRFDLLKEGKTIERARSMLHMDGRNLDIEYNVRKISDEQTITFYRDVSELRKAEKQIQVSEMTFRNAFEFSSLGVALVSIDGKWMKVNRKLCIILGYTATELLSLKLQDIIYPPDLSAHNKMIRKIISGNIESCQVEQLYLHKNGDLVHINLGISLVRDAQHQPLYFVSQIEDITDRKKAEDELKQAYERINYHINNTPLAVIERDRDLNITQWNKRAEEIYGWKRKEVIGRKTLDFLIHEDEKEAAKEVLANLQKGIVNNKPGENRYYRKDKSIVYCQWYHSLLKDENGEVQTILSIVKDITEQKNFEIELREAEIKFRSLVEQSLVGVYIVQNGRFAYVNPEFAKIAGYEQDELTDSYPVETVVYEEDRAMVTENLRARLQGEKKSVHYEVRGLKKDGTIIWTEVFGTRTTYKGKPAIIGTLLDITERKTAAEALQKSEANLHSILNTTETMYILLDNNFSVISFNQRARDFAGKTLQSQFRVGSHFAGSFRNGTERALLYKMRKAMEGKQVEYETSFQQQDNSFNWYHIKMIPIPDSDKKYFGLMVAISDITQRKITEQRLRSTMEQLTHQKVEEQKKITRAIINAQEKERNKMGLELHDNVNQLMASTRIYLTMVRKAISKKRDLVNKAIEYADSAIEEIRLLSRQQVTPVKNINLRELIQSLADQLNDTTGLHITFECLLPENLKVDNDLKLNIYRVIQEQLNNIYKHADASAVEIRMELKEKLIHITVTDNGRGFDTSKKKNGIGISNIINRVESYNGQVVIKSKAGKGCELNLSIPLSFPK